MVNILDSGTLVTIEINKNDLPLDEIYTRDYFLLLDLEIIDNDNIVESMGGMTIGGKSIVDTVIDKTESLVDYEIEQFNKGAETVINKGEASFNKTFDYTNANLTEDDNVIRIRIKKEHTPISLSKYLESYRENKGKITAFDSGLDYIELERIIRDVFIQLSYLDFLNISIDHIRIDEIYRINDRYVFIIENGISNKRPNESFMIINDFQKLIIELMGKKYEKGKSLELLEIIRGTRVYKIIRRMNDGVNNVW
jgi:hypothetical protein